MKAPEYCIDCCLTKPSACGATHGIPYIAIPSPECPLVLLDAANAENEILRQRNLSDPLIQATTKHLQAEIEQLRQADATGDLVRKIITDHVDDYPENVLHRIAIAVRWKPMAEEGE